jgi:cellulose synthase/poly-beta-1,6-N-acetylglucosamine synthase-like glycosyltransferase
VSESSEAARFRIETAVEDDADSEDAVARRRRLASELESRLVRSLVESDALDVAMLAEARAYQSRTGDPLSRVLVTLGHVDEHRLAKQLAEELGLEYVARPEPTPEAASSLPVPVCLLNRIVPLAVDGDTLVVAMADPLRERTVRALASATSRPTRIVVSPVTAIDTALAGLYSQSCVEVARKSLLLERPEASAYVTLSGRQKIVFGLLALGLGVGLGVALVPTLVGIAAVSIVFQFLCSAYRFVLVVLAARRVPELEFSSREIRDLDERTLPVYTILVPLYREADVLPDLVDALVALDYPKTKLDVKLLLEPDDRGTMAAAEGLHLGPWFQKLVVPDSLPKTKPKVCNYGLLWARGEFVVIYDAEDRPEPDQLKKAVLAFRTVDDRVACVQAKLNYWNRDQNFLTRLFTAEYSQQFDLLLPGLDATNAPIPLGGTSNHFKTMTLLSLGAWDPFNVTEDADLGVRLARAKLRTAMIDSTTYEEANSRPYNWLRQRSRWVKGYIQTWLVQMRRPILLARQLGIANWLSFQLIVAGAFLTLLLNPLYWTVTVLWVLTKLGLAHHLFPGIVYFAGSFNLLIGNFVFVYLNLAGLLRRRYDNLVKWALLSPVYWLLMSLGAWKGFLQLIWRPSYWEKTLHGLAPRS